jgi:hypothetical protein
MSSTLVFPDGVRLVEWDEIPGTESSRLEIIKRTEQANIAQGFILQTSGDDRFRFYAELNAHAPKVWAVFQNLCQALIRSDVTLLFSGSDLEPIAIGYAHISSVVGALSHYQYQLAHDGFLQFGVISEMDGMVSEVLVGPAKNFKVWLNDEAQFRLVMEAHGIPEADKLEFLDEYPRVTIRLPDGKGVLCDLDELASRLKYEIDMKPQAN